MAKKNQETKIETTPFFTKGRMFFIAIATAFLFFGNSIPNGYSLDDEFVTTTDRKSNTNVEKGIGGIVSIFKSNYAIDNKQNYEYRPIVTLSYAIEWSLFSDSENRVHISHFINVLLYGVCGFLIFQMLQVLFQGKQTTFSAVIAILFISHPIHSEVVNNLKNRDEILSLIFALLSVISVFKGLDKKQWKYFLFGVLFISFSLLSKRSSTPFLVIIPLMLWYFRDFSIKNIVLVGGTLAFGQIILKSLKSGVLDTETNRFFNFIENPLYQMNFIARIPMYFYSNWFYFQKLVLPYPLGFYYGFNTIPIVGFSSWQFFAGLALVGTGLYFAVKGFMKKSLVSFAVFFFFLAIGGACNLIGPIVGIVAERFVFIASIGFIILLTWLIFKWRKIELDEKKFNNSLFLPLAIILLPSFLYNVNRNQDWRSKKSLYIADHDYLIKSAKANSLLATEYQDEAYKLQPTSVTNFDEMMQKVDSALMFYNQSISIYQDYESNLNNRGALYYSFYYDYIEASRSFKLSTKMNSDYYEGLMNIGNSYSKIAEIYANLAQVSKIKMEIPPIGINTTGSNNISEIVLRTKYYRTLSLLNQFEFSAKQQLQNTYSQNTVNFLTLFAQNLEKLDPALKKLEFSNIINQVFTHFLTTKTQPQLTVLNGFRKAVYSDIISSTKKSDEVFAKECDALKNKYFDSAKVYFEKTYQLKPNYENLYTSSHQFALIVNDLHYIIKLEERFIKNFPGKYYSFQYIEIANSYYTLGNKEKAKENFKKAFTELKREKNDLKSKKSPTQEDLNRIEGLKNEIQRLKNYLTSLKLI